MWGVFFINATIHPRGFRFSVRLREFRLCCLSLWRSIVSRSEIGTKSAREHCWLWLQVSEADALTRPWTEWASKQLNNEIWKIKALLTTKGRKQCTEIAAQRQIYRAKLRLGQAVLSLAHTSATQKRATWTVIIIISDIYMYTYFVFTRGCSSYSIISRMTNQMQFRDSILFRFFLFLFFMFFHLTVPLNSFCSTWWQLHTLLLQCKEEKTKELGQNQRQEPQNRQ